MNRSRFVVRSLVSGLALLSAATLADAQRSGRPGVQQTLNAFLAEFGEDLIVRMNFDSGYVAEIYGHAMDLGWVPASDLEFEVASRDLADTFGGMFGYDSDVLELLHVHELPLSHIGASDKVSVMFRQVVDGMPVESGTLAFLYEADGRLLSISNHGLPNVEGMDLVPVVTDAEALSIAMLQFGREVLEVRRNEITVAANATRSGPALVWNVELRAVEWDGNLPVQELFAIDAGNGAVLRRENTIHTFTDLLGKVVGKGSPGTLPDKSSNPDVKFKLEDVLATSPVGNATSGSDGKFTIAYSGNNDQDITVDIGSSAQPRTWVVNTDGGELSKTRTATPDERERFRFNNKGTNAKKTAQVNCQKETVNLQNFVQLYNPIDNTMEFRVKSNANIEATCNAYFDGSSVNYYQAGGGCVNTAYSTVIYHEIGHWANVKYNQGNGSDGFGEGNADNWATKVADHNLVGQDFCGTGCHVRDGNNNRQYCGSCGAGCHGGVHSNGEVLMGAMWKARQNINATLGDAAGDLVDNTLFNFWNLVYNDTTICTSIRDHLLVLDDDDGNINNGTPHGTEIDDGFKAQGFPGFY